MATVAAMRPEPDGVRRMRRHEPRHPERRARGARWCKRCSRYHTSAAGCAPPASSFPCAALGCDEPATRRLPMTVESHELDVLTGAPTGPPARSRWMVPFCAAHGRGDELKPAR